VTALVRNGGADGRSAGARQGTLEPVARGRSTGAIVAVVFGALFLFAGFVALGTWQLERRVWKLDLIARVEQRVHAAAVMAPPSSQWPRLTAANSEYRHVRASGTFLSGSETLVQATTELGAGFWVLTALRRTDGSVVLVNRGFVPPDGRPPQWRDSATRGAGEPPGITVVTGLLRMTEPGGAFLRRNNAAANRWYSRDVQAIARARGLSRVAPYFIDADAVPRAAADSSHAPESSPVGGLTVIAFHNNHLVYAITWYTLALMAVGGAWLAVREERRTPPLTGP
jgi:surfeit locus 1 family protein